MAKLAETLAFLKKKKKTGMVVIPYLFYENSISSCKIRQLTSEASRISEMIWFLPFTYEGFADLCII